MPSDFQSSPNKRDGLYWPVKAGEQASPLGPLFVAAQTEGYKKSESGKPVPYHGYHYRILKAQGPNAPGGAYNYVVRGAMIGGFGLVAYPASYDSSGVMTFMVNHDGVLYEKDLGPETAAIAQRITKFDPDSTWKRVDEKMIAGTDGSGEIERAPARKRVTSKDRAANLQHAALCGEGARGDPAAEHELVRRHRTLGKGIGPRSNSWRAPGKAILSDSPHELHLFTRRTRCPGSVMKTSG